MVARLLFFLLILAIIIYGVGYGIAWLLTPKGQYVKFRLSLFKAKENRAVNKKIDEDIADYKKSK